MKLFVTLVACALLAPLEAAEHHGSVTFGGLPVPGATVTASRDGKTQTVTTDAQGNYSFADLADGVWSIEVNMLAFAPLKRDVTVSAGAAAESWELKLLSLDEIKAAATVISRPAVPAPPPPTTEAKADGETGKAAPKEKPRETAPAPAEPNPDTADNFLINGSVNNGAASPFAQIAAFGNNRRGARSLYNGSLGFSFDNSALDARAFSITGQDTPKPGYNHVTGFAAFGGPMKIPHLIRNGPNFFVAYQWTRNRNASVATALVPTLDQRNGNLSALGTQIFDPSGAPVSGNIISPNRISDQARALLKFYPLPNFSGNGSYNYQIPIVGSTHQDAVQARLNKAINRKHQISGSFGLNSVRSDSTNAFGFLDTTDTLGLTAGVTWRLVLTPRFFATTNYTFSRYSTRVTPFFANRENVSGNAGITGNLQDAADYGPPTLSFATGLASLTDAGASFTRNQTHSLSYSIFWGKSRHNVQAGIDFRRQQFNTLAQQDARGTFTFTGASTHSDFASFLFGVPDTVSIAYGNADKYFRTSTYNVYVNDDWRISPELTLNYGVRWEYGSPITEIYGRLVNLDIASGFIAAQPVVALNPTGALTGQRYPDSLIKPDKSGFEPRLGLSWRPISGSSMIIRAGYGLYYNTSVYQNIATQMAQQAPLSKNITVANPGTLTLANGFANATANTLNTFAVDPNFRVGYAHNWQVSMQRDLPGGLVMTATYAGLKGSRGEQEFLPNTYPIGDVNPCPLCPSGFVYLASNGNSTRESGSFQLRRRLHNGFTATLQYTFSKSIDDTSGLGGSAPITSAQSSPAMAGGGGAGGANQNAAAPSATSSRPASIAQNWLDLSAERGLSNFDQRHLLSVTGQYTSGIGIRGGTLMSGWRGALLKEWTIATQITAGSGLPLTPVYIAPVQGTGITGPIRPDYTGAPLYVQSGGSFLNPAAYAAPVPGQWGNAGRNSIIGPAQFSLNGSLSRTFRINDRFSLDASLNATNALNHVTYPSWITVINNPAQFGTASAANPMRSVLTSFRLRF